MGWTYMLNFFQLHGVDMQLERIRKMVVHNSRFVQQPMFKFLLYNFEVDFYWFRFICHGILLLYVGYSCCFLCLFKFSKQKKRVGMKCRYILIFKNKSAILMSLKLYFSFSTWHLSWWMTWTASLQHSLAFWFVLIVQFIDKSFTLIDTLLSLKKKPKLCLINKFLETCAALTKTEN